MSLVPLLRFSARLWQRTRARIARLRAPSRRPSSPVGASSVAPTDPRTPRVRTADRAVALGPGASLISLPVSCLPIAADRDPESLSSNKEGFLAGLHRFQHELCALVEPFAARPPAPVRRPRKWRQYMPRLARTCADLMDFAGPLFTHFSFGGPDLRLLEQEVHQLGEFHAFLHKAAKTVSRLHALRKAELGERTLEVVEQVRALQQMPALSVQEQGLSRQALALIESVLGPSREATRGKRRERAALRAQGAAEVEEAQARLRAATLEAQVLRGGSLTAADLQRGAPGR